MHKFTEMCKRVWIVSFWYAQLLFELICYQLKYRNIASFSSKPDYINCHFFSKYKTATAKLQLNLYNPWLTCFATLLLVGTLMYFIFIFLCVHIYFSLCVCVCVNGNRVPFSFFLYSVTLLQYFFPLGPAT